MSRFVKRSHTVIRDWIQKYKPEMLSSRKLRITGFIINETIIKVGSEYIWLWIAIENDNLATDYDRTNINTTDPSLK